jgi:predicted PurR-regulated permease PerM
MTMASNAAETSDAARRERPPRAAGAPGHAQEAAAHAEAANAPPEPERVLLHMPVDVRSASLFVIAFLLVVYALRWAQDVFVPLLMGMLFCYALSPLVNRLVRIGLPRAIAATCVMAAIAGALGSTVYALGDQADNLIESLPEAAKKLRDTVHAMQPRPSDNKIVKMQKAATQIEQAAAESASASVRPPPGVTRVQVVKPTFDIQDYLLSGTVRAASFAANTVIVLLVTGFLLVAGDTFRRKLARIAGPTFARRKITVQALNEIGEQIQRYLLVQLATSIAVGIATWLAFWAIGFNNAGAWGIVAAVLDLIPYIGAAVMCVASSVVALLQFGTIGMVLAVAGISIVLHIVSGYLLTPWLTSRASRLNATVVFIGVLAWGWLWGVWGLLLGTPILMAVKAVCDRIDGLKPIGELLGGTEQDEARDAETIQG